MGDIPRMSYVDWSMLRSDRLDRSQRGAAMSDAARDTILAALLEGPFRRLRDDNHIDPHRILVWDQQQQPVIQALTILELLGPSPAAMPRMPSGAQTTCWRSCSASATCCA